MKKPLYITTRSIDQQAYPVGESKDAYYIITTFTLDTSTDVVTSNSELHKNYYSTKSKLLFSGSFNQCFDKVVEIVEKEGIWEFDRKNNLVFQPPLS